MKLIDNYDEVNKIKSTTVALIVATSLIVVVLALVLLFNRNFFTKKLTTSASADVVSSLEAIPEAEEYHSTGLTVADLDFYDMYKDKDEETETSVVETEEPVTKDEPEIDESNDGKHTYVTDYDGTGEWAVISPYLTKNTYDFSNLLSSNGKMRYFEDGRCVSSFGVDISKDNDYVDFVKLQKAGCDFVMLRAGARGYETGLLSIDDYFKDNLKRATDAGLDVGVYFLSQAVSEAEAIEEANYIADNLGDYSLSYPIAFVMQYAHNDKSRIDSLSKNAKSMIARAFLNTVKDRGFKAMLFGDKAWLIKHVDLSKLINDYDIWYSETGVDLPDYPYKFTMWQYDKKGTIDGVSGYVNFNICFLDYSLK